MLFDHCLFCKREKNYLAFSTVQKLGSGGKLNWRYKVANVSNPPTPPPSPCPATLLVFANILSYTTQENRKYFVCTPPPPPSLEK